MDDDKLSAREKAMIAEARSQVGRRTGPLVAAPPQAKPALAPEDRLARLMAEERAETERRKTKMRRYGIAVPAAILALFALWVLRASRRR